ncbi:MAG: SGNH/GDSL hydrolase family protein, partial [Armatimonadota bacterium]
MRIAPGATLLLTGDSITDCGRARPVGEGGGIGDGYARLVADRLPGMRVLNTGISGNTVRHLAGRWEADVAGLAPDWLSIMIGTNDVWRQFDHLDAPVDPVDYEAIYSGLLSSIRPRLQGLVLMTPFLVEANLADPMRARMDEYRAIVLRLAGRHGAYFVDTQAVFNRALGAHTVADLAPDRV